MSGGLVGSPTKARSDPASHPIQTITNSIDSVIYSLNYSLLNKIEFSRARYIKVDSIYIAYSK